MTCIVTQLGRFPNGILQVERPFFCSVVHDSINRDKRTPLSWADGVFRRHRIRVLFAEVPYNFPFKQPGINMRSFLKQMLLGLLGPHSSVLDQPTNRNCGAPSSACFAMNVDFLPFLDEFLNELDSLLHVDQTGGRKIGRRYPQLLDSRYCIELVEATELFACVDNSSDPHFPIESRNVLFQRPSTQ
jgi:hypothetical protein